jgi:hypothetical protein
MTREETLNNPGGIVHTADKWLGMSPDQPDIKFVKFLSPYFGLRAMVKTIRSYQREGINTLTALANKWAPQSDSNDPKDYAQYLADRCCWHPDTPVVFDSIMLVLIRAIVSRENGTCVYSDDLIRSVIQGKPLINLDPPRTPFMSTVMNKTAPLAGGTALGASVSAIVVDAIKNFLHVTPDPTAQAAIGVICTVALLHFFPTIAKDQP